MKQTTPKQERRGMRELALFAGAGGGILAGHLLGWRTLCAVEVEPYPASVLVARQNDGILPPFPVWDDVCTFDGRPWRGRVDVISGGFPCQDISSAGRGAGIEGARSGLWKEMFRVICEVRPRFVLVENSPMLASRGLGRVLGDLASVGFNAEWDVFGAHHIGAPHKRDRMWILAYADSERLSSWRTELAACAEKRSESDADAAQRGEDVPHAHLPGREEQREHESNAAKHATTQCGRWWLSEPRVGRVVDGVAARVDRLKALGNGQVPAVAAMAFSILAAQFDD